MIHLLTLLIGLSLFSVQILAEWLAGHRREAVKAYASFQRTENVYPKYRL